MKECSRIDFERFLNLGRRERRKSNHVYETQWVSDYFEGWCRRIEFEEWWLTLTDDQRKEWKDFDEIQEIGCEVPSEFRKWKRNIESGREEKEEEVSWEGADAVEYAAFHAGYLKGAMREEDKNAS